jgi:hypothetical protein
VRFDERDRLLLEFASHHRLILASQAALVLQVDLDDAEVRLDALRDGGLIRDARSESCPFPGEQITGAGLRAISSPLRAPRQGSASGYHHDVRLGWLWLAARSGAFGTLRGVVSERHMRSHDRRGEEWAQRFGVRLGGVGPAGHERLHYPDLVLKTASGRRVALELELTRKPSIRLSKILAGYAADPRIDAVVYLVEKPTVAANISRAAARMGISDLVHVQRVSFAVPGGHADALSDPLARPDRRAARTAGHADTVSDTLVRHDRRATRTAGADREAAAR